MAAPRAPASSFRNGSASPPAPPEAGAAENKAIMTAAASFINYQTRKNLPLPFPLLSVLTT